MRIHFITCWYWVLIYSSYWRTSFTRTRYFSMIFIILNRVFCVCTPECTIKTGVCLFILRMAQSSLIGISSNLWGGIFQLNLCNDTVPLISSFCRLSHGFSLLWFICINMGQSFLGRQSHAHLKFVLNGLRLILCIQLRPMVFVLSDPITSGPLIVALVHTWYWNSSDASRVTTCDYIPLPHLICKRRWTWLLFA